MFPPHAQPTSQCTRHRRVAPSCNWPPREPVAGDPEGEGCSDAGAVKEVGWTAREMRAPEIKHLPSAGLDAKYVDDDVFWIWFPSTWSDASMADAAVQATCAVPSKRQGLIWAAVLAVASTLFQVGHGENTHNDDHGANPARRTESKRDWQSMWPVPNPTIGSCFYFFKPARPCSWLRRQRASLSRTRTSSVPSCDDFIVRGNWRSADIYIFKPSHLSQPSLSIFPNCGIKAGQLPPHQSLLLVASHKSPEPVSLGGVPGPAKHLWPPVQAGSGASPFHAGTETIIASRCL